MIISATEVIPAAELLDRVDRLAAILPAERAQIAVQLRSPELSSSELFALGATLRERTRRVGALLLLNDRLDLARLLGADGIHLGRRSVSVAEARAFLGDGPLISVACHAPIEVASAATAGADLVTLSPIFASPGKSSPIGLGALREASELAPGVPILALGGVVATNAAACRGAGAHGVAAIRADPSSLLAALSSGRSG